MGPGGRTGSPSTSNLHFSRLFEDLSETFGKPFGGLRGLGGRTGSPRTPRQSITLPIPNVSSCAACQSITLVNPSHAYSLWLLMWSFKGLPGGFLVLGSPSIHHIAYSTSILCVHANPSHCLMANSCALVAKSQWVNGPTTFEAV